MHRLFFRVPKRFIFTIFTFFNRFRRLTSGLRSFQIHESWQNINDRKYDNPDSIHKMPVNTYCLNDRRIFITEITQHRHDDQNRNENQSDKNMKSMKSRECKKIGSEYTGSQSDLIIDQSEILASLSIQENSPQHQRDDQPDFKLFNISPFKILLSEMKSQAAAQ